MHLRDNLHVSIRRTAFRIRPVAARFFDDCKNNVRFYPVFPAYIGYVLLALACIGVIAGYYFLKVRNRDDQEEEDETAYGDDEQPDDIYDSEAEPLISGIRK